MEPELLGALIAAITASLVFCAAELLKKSDQKFEDEAKMKIAILIAIESIRAIRYSDHTVGRHQNNTSPRLLPPVNGVQTIFQSTVGRDVDPIRQDLQRTIVFYGKKKPALKKIANQLIKICNQLKQAEIEAQSLIYNQPTFTEGKSSKEVSERKLHLWNKVINGNDDDELGRTLNSLVHQAEKA